MIVDEDVSNPQTLCDWVKNFRIKKIQMKRKVRGGGELRISAMITQALLNAEDKLRRKQQDRFSRWMALQSKLQSNNSNNYNNSSSAYSEHVMKNGEHESAAEERQQRDEITNLWKYELSGLDEFMRNISSNGVSGSYGGSSSATNKSNKIFS